MAVAVDDEEVVLLLEVQTPPLLHFKLCFLEDKPLVKCLLNGGLRVLPCKEDYMIMVEGDSIWLHNSQGRYCELESFFDRSLSFCESSLITIIVSKADGSKTRVEPASMNCVSSYVEHTIGDKRIRLKTLTTEWTNPKRGSEPGIYQNVPVGKSRPKKN